MNGYKDDKQSPSAVIRGEEYPKICALSYVYHQDPAHGWIEVAEIELYRLGIGDEISAYSYKKNGQAFLEEDSDASKFAKAKRAAGEDFTVVYAHTNESSLIRDYPSYAKKNA